MAKRPKNYAAAKEKIGQSEYAVEEAIALLKEVTNSQ